MRSVRGHHSVLRTVAAGLALTLVVGLVPASAVDVLTGASTTLPWGAATEAPVQRSGSATLGGHRASSGSTSAALALEKRSSPRPAGAVADREPALPEVRGTSVAQQRVKPALHPSGDVPAIDTAARERVADRTATTQTFDNPDGTRTLRVHSGQSSVDAPGGGRNLVDLNLVNSADGRLLPRTSPVEVSFAPAAPADELVRMNFGPGRSLSYGLAGANRSTGIPERDHLTYREVFKDVDLRLSATRSGVKEDLVLASAAAPNTYAFSLRPNGITPRLAVSGAVELVSGAEIVAVIPPGFMDDSAPQPVRSTAVRYELEPAGGGSWTLRVVVDRGWLTDPARVFPVTVDPSVGRYKADVDDTYVAQGNSGNQNDIELATGYVNGKLSRSYLRLSSALQSLRNQYIVGASLVVDNIYTTTCSPRSVTVFEVTQPWGSSMSWPGAGVGQALGSKAFAHGAPGCSGAAWEGIPLNAGVMTRWTHGAGVPHGLSLRASNEADRNGMRFASANTPNAPYLDVRYSPEGASFEVESATLPSATREGRLVAKVTNLGTSTWAAGGGFRFGYVITRKSNGEHVRTVHDWAPSASVAPMSTTTFDVPVAPLTPDVYTVKMSMWGPDGRSFLDAHEVPYGTMELTVQNTPPGSDYQEPGTGATVETRTPTLYAEPKDDDNWPAKGFTYRFRICTDQELSKDCQESDWGGQTWTPAPLSWSRTYFWGVKVHDTITPSPSWIGPLVLSTRVHQPEITSHLAGNPEGRNGTGLDPQIGNYSTVATDASVTTPGPDLTITRTYNSLDPRDDTAFGRGWSSRLDMRLDPDNDGSGNVVITFPTGRQARFGKNPDGSFAPPTGQNADLVYSTVSGHYTLRDAAAGRWVFDALGRLAEIIDSAGLRETLEYGANDRIATITSETSKRVLGLTWDGNRVTRVQAPAPVAGGVSPVWTYSYEGGRLVRACAPAAGENCTNYTHTPGSLYRSTVVDNNPRAYWRLGDSSGSTLASAVSRRPGADVANQHGVIFGVEGALGGSTDKAVVFDGSGSRVALPEKLASKNLSLAVELWFRTTSNGTLISYADKPFPEPATFSTPLLYVGVDGLLHGGFSLRDSGAARQIVSSTPVNDDKWHHAVLSGAINTQTLYLDGKAVGRLPGLIDHRNQTRLTLGAGSGKDWPSTNGEAFHFGGTLDEVALYTHTLGPLAVARHHAAGTTVDKLSGIALPQDGKRAASLTYDAGSDRVATLLDQQGLTWKLDQPQVLDSTVTSVLRGPSSHGDWTYTADADNGGRPLSSSHRGATKKFEYNTAGFLAATVDENGNRTEQTTDARGNVLSRKTCRATESCNTQYFTYLSSTDPLDPRRDKLATSSDARSEGPEDTRFRTTYGYDSLGRPSTLTLPKPEGVTVAPQETSTFSTGSEDAVDGGKVPAGLLIRSTGKRGQVTTRQYRANGDLAVLISPSGLRTKYTYDLVGRQRTVTEANAGDAPLGTTTYEYNSRSQVTKVTEPPVVNPVTGVTHTKVTTNRFDANGKLVETTSADATPRAQGGDVPRTTSYTYDSSDRLATTTFADGGKESTAYRDNALSRTITDVRGTAWTEQIDEFGRVLARSASGRGVNPENPAATSMVLEVNAYDPGGRLSSTTDAMGRTTTYTYYGDNLLATVSKRVENLDGTTRTVELERRGYDPAGHLTEEVTAGGVKAVQTYDPAGLVLASVFDPDGLKRSTTFLRDADGNPVRTEHRGAADPNRVESSTYAYDAQNLLTRRDSQLDANTVTSATNVRDERGLVRSSTDRRGITTTFDYDANGELVHTIDPPTEVWAAGVSTKDFKRVETVGRNTFGEITHSRDGAGGVTITEWDVLGRAVAGTLPPYTPPGGNPITPTTRTEYDHAGNPIKVIDALGRSTVRTYDPYNRLLTTSLPPVGDFPAVVTAAYDKLGELLVETDASGASTRHTYDQLGNRLTSTRADRSSGTTVYYTTTHTYDDAGNMLSTRTPQGFTTVFTYNAAGEKLTETDPTGRTRSFTHDNAGRDAGGTDPAGLSTQVSYNLIGQPVRMAHLTEGVQRRSTSSEYDGNGNLTRHTTAEGRTSTYGYDELNRLTHQVEHVEANRTITTALGYDRLGNRSRFVDGNGNATDYTYTPWGQPESVVEPATAATPALADRTWTTSYDAAGRAVRVAKPGGVLTTREYDARDRLVLERGSGAQTPTADRILGYDQADRVVRASGPTGESTFRYDDRGNLLESRGAGGASTYTYNADSTMASRTDASGAASFGYDSAARLTSVTDPVTGRTVDLGYDSAGRRASVIDRSAGGRIGRYTSYDLLGRLASDRVERVISVGAPPQVLLGTEYGYDNDDKITTKKAINSTGTATNTYGYDGAARLSSWTDRTGTATAYGWDAAGNRVSAGDKTYTYDQRNRLTEGAGARYDYTPRGTLTKVTQGTTVRESAFDAFDRMTVNGLGHYGYDSLDRVSDRNGTAFTYDGRSNEVVSDGSRLVSRLPDGSAFADRSVADPASGRMSYSDAHGDVVGRYLNASTEGLRGFDPFGKVISSTAGASSLGFQGDWTDSETGAVNMSARWYSPETGRFLSRDDWTLDPKPSAAANRYAYGNADPLANTDPTGHYADPCDSSGGRSGKGGKAAARGGVWGFFIVNFFCNSAPLSGECRSTMYDQYGNPCGAYKRELDRRRDRDNAALDRRWHSEEIRGGHRKIGGPGTSGPRPRPVFDPPKPPPPPQWVIDALSPLGLLSAGSTVVTGITEVAATTAATLLRDLTIDFFVDSIKINEDDQADPTGVDLPTDDAFDEDDCFGGAANDKTFNDPVQTINYSGPRPRGVPKNGSAYRATGGTACLATTNDAARSKPQTPFGYVAGRHHRSHLIGHQLHGSNQRDNIVPLDKDVNTPDMLGVENQVAAAVDKGQKVYYRVTANYTNRDDAVPASVHIRAVGDGGFVCDVTIYNPHPSNGYPNGKNNGSRPSC
ncbi:RHS repeat-associated core domain-containing protein [Allokutzneria oryzae]|uniref:RHS repeat-associated core domain-containing protein n=1 Tax=Allokutzneria oryzae TaxID=1378989 RepID=A0ABV5ZTJ9_9PSEU